MEVAKASVEITARMAREVLALENISLKDMFQAYLECALWTSAHRDDPRGLTAESSIENLSDLALASLYLRCMDFFDHCGEMISEEQDRCFKRAGHDLWLAQSVHRAGFWQGDWPANAKAMSDAALSLKPLVLYADDSGVIHLESESEPESGPNYDYDSETVPSADSAGESGIGDLSVE